METDDKKQQQGQNETPETASQNSENTDSSQQNKPNLSDAPTFDESWDKQEKFRAD